MIEIGRKVRIEDPSMVQFTENCSENKKERFYNNYKKNNWVVHHMNWQEQEPRGLVLVNEEGLYASIMSNFVSQIRTVYLSGPMTGYENHNREIFEKYEKNLTSLGFDVVNPHKLGLPDGLKHEEYMKADLAALLKCDCIAFMPEKDATGEHLWYQSKGCKAEMLIAMSSGIEMINAATGTETDEFFLMVHPYKK